MVIERRHGGRTVPCPRCKAPTEVPAGLDFNAVDAAATVDRNRSSWLLVATIGAGASCCLPASAYLAWSASGSMPSMASDRATAPPDGALSASVCCSRERMPASSRI